MQDLIKFEIVELVKEINKNEPRYICQKTENTLYRIYKDILTSEEIENISVLYRLIFYAFKVNPIIAYQILSGFLQFGQSDEGTKYKPLLDHLAIEAFDQLIELGGYAILKDCINNLRDNLTHLTLEPIFKHIVLRIVNQLYADEQEEESPDNLSDICYHLPREKSFTWGWFSYYIAEAYYIAKDYNAEPYYTAETYYNLNKKKMRHYLMNYRKLITSLRQFVPKDDPTIIIADTNMENKLKETWAGVLTGLSAAEYTWAAELINCIMDQTVEQQPIVPAPAPAPVSVSVSAAITSAEIALAISSADDLEYLIEKAIAKLQAQEEKAQEEKAQEEKAQEEKAQEEKAQVQEEKEEKAQVQEEKEEFIIIQSPPEQEKNKNAGWFDWFGWP